jgi:hypothetical protein
VFAGTEEGRVFVSDNYGDSWVDISHGLVGGPVLSLHTYDDTLYAGVNAGGVWKYPVSEPRGACCQAGGVCSQTTQAYCEDVLDGLYLGDGEICGPESCNATCCLQRGDVNHSGDPGPIDVSDLVYLVNYMFKEGPAPPCWPEADVNGLGDPDSADISDLVYLVNYMFKEGPEPPPCP